jgi:hypothetical protein
MRELKERHELKDDNGNVYGVINEFVGYEHYCDKDQAAYDAWHERNKDNTYEVYKNDYIDCFEPTEFAESLDNMISLAEEILENLNK